MGMIDKNKSTIYRKYAIHLNPSPRLQYRTGYCHFAPVQEKNIWHGGKEDPGLNTKSGQYKGDKRIRISGKVIKRLK